MSELPQAPSFLLLCSTGRAGSTLTMRILSQHQDVMVRDRFPYETRFRQYAEAGALNGSVAVSQAPESHGPVAYAPCQGEDQEAIQWIREQGARHAPSAGAALAFYKHLADAQDKTAPRWIAEKAIGIKLSTHLLETDPQCRALFLFRDPRDVYFSMKAFNRKAPYSSGFGETNGNEAMFRSIVYSWRRFTQLRQAFPGRIYRCNYESITAGRAAYFQRLFEWLGVRNDLPYLRQMLRQALERDPLTEHHSTTESAEQSIGRWQTEADDQDRALFLSFASDIAAMGYDV